MIKKIRLQNFQSHKDTTFEFANGVNSIIGKTDAGKSACIRALQWVVYNKPAGTSMISHGAGKCEVTIWTDDHVIRRVRSDKDNKYFLDNEELSAFGQGVPEAVVEALNMDEINVQSQMDSPFLLTETPGQVGRMLNKKVNLDNIDSSLKSVNSYRKKLNRSVKALKEEITELDAQIEAIDYIYIESVLEKTRVAETEITALESKIVSLTSAVVTADEASVYKEREIQLRDALERRDAIEQQLVMCNSIDIDVDALSELLQSISRCHELIADASKMQAIDTESIDALYVKLSTLTADISFLEDVVVQRVERPSINTNLDVETIDMLMSSRDEIYKRYENLRETLELVDQLGTSIEETEESIHEQSKDLGSTCPMCGGKL